jgi:hypothetical protein
MKNNENLDREAAISVIRSAAAKFQGTFICRENVEGFTGGAVRARHLANLDSQGLGVPNSFKVGRRQCYPIDSLVDWLISRLEVKS